MPCLSFITDESEQEISNMIKDKKIYIIEENSIIGGLGDLIFNISCKYNIPIDAKKIAIPNEFLTKYGKAEQHREKLGLTSSNFKQILD